MIKRLSLAFLAFTISLSALGQDGKGAIILQYDEGFKMTSPSSGTHTVHSVVMVLDESGLDAAVLFLVSDSFRSLADFKGEITQPGNKKTKLSKKDLTTFSLSTGLADDSYATVYEPQGKYPFTVQYDYSISYKGGIHTFPSFYPLPFPRTELVNATFTLEVPKGCEVKSATSKVKEIDAAGSKSSDVYKWETGHIEAIPSEHDMPPFRDLVPVILSNPVDFKYANTTGNQKDWKNLGIWLYSLQKDCDDLPETEVSKILEMTAGCPDTYSKVRILYNYLKEKTRYVSVQLGIGGLRPEPSSMVAKTGYGDCKALSNYMRSILKAAGVESKYYAIHTSKKKLLKDYSSLGQMDHVMLAVPLPENGDTLFVECTNPSFPLGYRHSSCAGHDILLIDETGGSFTTIRSYPDSLSRTEKNTEVWLSSDGSAKIDVEGKYFLDESEFFISFEELRAEQQRSLLTNGWKLQPDNLMIKSVRNNFNDYPLYERLFCPEVTVCFSMDCTVYANKNAGRLFLPINPMARQIYTQRTPRVNDLYFSSGQILTDRFTIHLPEGFQIESLPDNTTITSDWGIFSSSVSKNPDGSLSVEQTFRGLPCRRDKSHYAAFKEFAKSINKAYSATIVLVAK